MARIEPHEATGTKTQTDADKYFPNLKSDAFNSRIAIWQYASCGFVAGIPVRVDMNNMYIDLTGDGIVGPATRECMKR